MPPLRWFMHAALVCVGFVILFFATLIVLITIEDEPDDGSPWHYDGDNDHGDTETTIIKT